MYDELVKALRGPYNSMTDTQIKKQAADAIEKLGDWWAMADKLIEMLQMPKEVLTGTDMRSGIRRDEAGNVIDWGITGPPGDVGKTEEE